MKDRKIKVFYTPKQVAPEDIRSGYSKSPIKPKLLMAYLKKHGIAEHLDVVGDFDPYVEGTFRIAHHKKYVREFFDGGKRNGGGIPWSSEFAESVRYTSASLYEAIKYANEHPETATFSPTSGFHHAQPHNGSGFCTFSGQVIASTRLYRDKGLRGAYFDLDGHFGNSIEDSRKFVTDLDESIPFNINPSGTHEAYIKSFNEGLEKVGSAILAGYIDYVVFCHGADSHQDDQLGSQTSTKEWIKCSALFYEWVRELEIVMGKHIPVTMALFGGYRDDSYSSVLSLHTADLVKCLNTLCGHDIEYRLRVKPRPRPVYVAPTYTTYKPYVDITKQRRWWEIGERTQDDFTPEQEEQMVLDEAEVLDTIPNTLPDDGTDAPLLLDDPTKFEQYNDELSYVGLN